MHGVATGPVVRLWDFRAKGVQMTLEDAGQAGSVRSMHFSENGYMAATGDAGGTVRLWDLRNQSVKHQADLAGAADAASGTSAADAVAAGIRQVRFDDSGRYLGIAVGGRIELMGVKKWKNLGRIVPQGDGAAPSCFAFGQDAKTVVVGGGDRFMRVFEAGLGGGSQAMMEES